MYDLVSSLFEEEVWLKGVSKGIKLTRGGLLMVNFMYLCDWIKAR